VGSFPAAICPNEPPLPSRSFAINTAWLAVVMHAVDLTAWTQHLLLHGDLAKAEPKTLRHRLLHRRRPADPRDSAGSRG
jgi:hypothetical protein